MPDFFGCLCRFGASTGLFFVGACQSLVRSESPNLHRHQKKQKKSGTMGRDNKSRKNHKKPQKAKKPDSKTDKTPKTKV